MTQGDAAEKEKEERRARVVEKWVPDRIICKRFNIADPYEDSREPADKNTAPQVPQGESVEQWLRMDINQHPMGGVERGSGEKEEVVYEEGVVERPSMDLFRAIFADSDDEDDSEAESVDMVVELPPPAPPSVIRGPKREPIREEAVIEDTMMEEVVESRNPVSFKPTFRKKGDRSSVAAKRSEKRIVAVDPAELAVKSSVVQESGVDMDDIPVVVDDRKKSKKKKKEKRRRSEVSFVVDEWEEQ